MCGNRPDLGPDPRSPAPPTQEMLGLVASFDKLACRTLHIHHERDAVEGKGIVLDTLYVKVDYDDHDSSFELIGRLSFSDPTALPDKQPCHAPSEPSLDFPVQLTDNSSPSDPLSAPEPSLIPAEPFPCRAPRDQPGP